MAGYNKKEKTNIRKEKKMKFIGYIPLGYPSISDSLKSIDVYVEAGCGAVEISFPLLDPEGESEMIVEFMRKALQKCSEYEKYMDAVSRIRLHYPDLEINLLLFSKVINEIGIDKIADFYKKREIADVICPDINENLDLKNIMSNKGIRLVTPFHYDVRDEELKECIASEGFVYMQAFPPEWQKVKAGYETPDRIVKYLRDHGVKQKIYAGVGIRTLEDVRTIKEAGADGFFVGATLMNLLQEPDRLREKIKEFIEEGKRK